VELAALEEALEVAPVVNTKTAAVLRILVVLVVAAEPPAVELPAALVVGLGSCSQHLEQRASGAHGAQYAQASAPGPRRSEVASTSQMGSGCDFAHCSHPGCRATDPVCFAALVPGSRSGPSAPVMVLDGPRKSWWRAVASKDPRWPIAAAPHPSTALHSASGSGASAAGVVASKSLRPAPPQAEALVEPAGSHQPGAGRQPDGRSGQGGAQWPGGGAAARLEQRCWVLGLAVQVACLGLQRLRLAGCLLPMSQAVASEPGKQVVWADLHF